MIRRFEAPGFEIDHVTGSHYIMKHEDGRRASVPRHDPVKTGLILGQLKRLGIEWEEFSEGL